MSTHFVWQRRERCLLDGEPFVLEIREAPEGFRVRISFEGRPAIEDDTAWPDLESARGRGYQMADEHIEKTLH